MQEPDLHHTAAKFAHMLAFFCVRNSSLETLHAGMFPSSKTGDYSDVKVVSPYGEIAWNQLSRISDEEMKPLMEEIVNRLYTFLFHVLTVGDPEGGMPLPKNWSAPQMDADIAQIWHENPWWAQEHAERDVREGLTRASQGSPPMAATKTTPASPVYQLKVTLIDSQPPIWRRLQVKSDTTLYKLHQILQITMGWTNSHLHQFVADGVCYGEPDPDYGFAMVSERRTRLHQILRRVRAECIYEYDFGDGWDHAIMLEQVLEPEAHTHYPRCLIGKRHCPPEDVGGMWGYRHFLEAIGDEDHPEHDEYRAWIGGAFDPDTFDLAEVNRALRRMR